MNKVWISKAQLDELMRKAGAMFPLETGGVLMGYWADSDVVISTIIGPGSGAIHNKTSFTPDYTFHESEVARIYRGSGGQWTYLGDWHTHPEQAIPALSAKDICTLRWIARSKAARAAKPLMGVLANGLDGWTFSVWKLQLARFVWSQPRPTPLNLQVY